MTRIISAVLVALLLFCVIQYTEIEVDSSQMVLFIGCFVVFVLLGREMAPAVHMGISAAAAALMLVYLNAQALAATQHVAFNGPLVPIVDAVVGGALAVGTWWVVRQHKALIARAIDKKLTTEIAARVLQQLHEQTTPVPPTSAPPTVVGISPAEHAEIQAAMNQAGTMMSAGVSPTADPDGFVRHTQNHQSQSASGCLPTGTGQVCANCQLVKQLATVTYVAKEGDPPTTADLCAECAYELEEMGATVEVAEPVQAGA